MDCHSRYVPSWERSNTLDASFCVAALERVLQVSRPEIFNSDQGAQFTSEAFTGRLDRSGGRISMDNRGRAFENIFVERLWRGVKYEEVYLKDYRTMPEARGNLWRYFYFYNTQRPHQSLGYRTPAEVHFDRADHTDGRRSVAAAVTPVALRAPSVAATQQGERVHLNPTVVLC